MSYLLEDALERLATNQEANIDLFGQQENDEVTERLNEELENINIDDSFVDEEFTYNNIGSFNNSCPLTVFQDSVIIEIIRSLNAKQ